jgi:hypothetical protein
VRWCRVERTAHALGLISKNILHNREQDSPADIEKLRFENSERIAMAKGASKAEKVHAANGEHANRVPSE